MVDAKTAGNAAGKPGAKEATASSGSFWGSLKGIITAVTGLIVAVGGLITVLNNTGVIGSSERAEAGEREVAREEAGPPTPAETPEPAATVAQTAPPPALEPASQPASGMETRLFAVGPVSDGWAAVRTDATVSSAMLSRLETGTYVRCGRTTPDTTGVPGRNWRYCPEVGGYIAARLLRTRE